MAGQQSHNTRRRKPLKATPVKGVLGIVLSFWACFAALAGPAPEEKQAAPAAASTPTVTASDKATTPTASAEPQIPLKFYQVAIEAIVVEINEKYSRQLGIQYTYARTDPDSGDIVSGIDVNAPNTPDPVIVPQMSVIPGGVKFTHDERTLGAGIEAGRMDIAAGLVGLRLQGLIEEGKARIRSRPLAVTLNKQKAEIETSDKVPYQDVTFNDAGAAKMAVKFEPVGVILHVTPDIKSLEDGLVELNLEKLEVSTVGRFMTVRGVQRPVFVKSEANTNVVMHDHDTLVVGGFKIELDMKTGSGVPFVRRIPIIKYAFSNESKSLERRDVQFYITPHILPPGIQPTLPPKFINQDAIRDLLPIPPLDTTPG